MKSRGHFAFLNRDEVTYLIIKVGIRINSSKSRANKNLDPQSYLVCRGWDVKTGEK